jgi:two-component system sensor histidine kinase HydH
VVRIKSEIRNLKHLLNEFLDFARPYSIQKEKILLPELALELQTLLSEDIQEKNATWSFEIQPEAETVQADRVKIKQALLNLYKNAFQALPHSGKVFSSVRKNGNGILMEIRNSQSSKIIPEVEEKMFEPFFTTKEKGIGLGLPLAKGIIESHGGEIRLSENNGEYVTFTIHLPVDTSAGRSKSIG